jgi:hypothetical protein
MAATDRKTPHFIIEICLVQSTLKVGPVHCPETSVNNYHTTLHNNPEEHRSHQWLLFVLCN